MVEENTVFVSSTCHDLIDVRAELEHTLRQMKLKPRLSDRPTSDFEVEPDKDSIQICLANVEKCQFFLIILSQRYGASCAKAGYPDESATHLEYHYAKALKKPMFVYLRQRLYSEYELWKKNPKATFSWVKNPSDHRLFEFIREHEALKADGGTSNWFETFDDSVELKRLVERDFQKPAASALVERMRDENKLPILVPHIPAWQRIEEGNNIRFDFELGNYSAAVAFQPTLTFKGHQREQIHHLPPLANGSSFRKQIEIFVNPSASWETKAVVEYNIVYATLGGHLFEDNYQLVFSWPGAVDQQQPRIHHVDTHYLGQMPSKITV